MPPNTNAPLPPLPPVFPAPILPPRKKKWPYIMGGIILVLLAAVFVLTQSEPSSPDDQSVPAADEDVSSMPATSSTEYANPELVTLEGYSGPQQDPVISPDGQYLFFDSHNDAGSPMHIHWAKRIDYKTFSYLGRVPGIEYEGIEGALDAEGNFYFLSPPAFLPQGGTTMGRGTFTNGTVTGIAPLKGITPLSVPAGSESLTFDMAITPDGDTLYFSEFILRKGAGTGPRAFLSAQLSMAKKNPDGTFTRMPNSAEILRNVNALGSKVYNAAPSADGLVLAFNAAPSVATLPNIFLATRTSPTDPFGKPVLISAADDVAEGDQSEVGSISPDGKHIYFHRVLTPKTSQLYVLMRQ